MRQFAASYPDVAPEQIVHMATQCGARALGLQERAGGIFHGGGSDLIAIPFAGKVGDAWEAVVHHKSDVSNSMIDGCWIAKEKAKG
jgi:cytosine/adenosine deaminase-related metal-dependent hydrolase